MSGVQETSCKLCLKTVTVNGFEVIDNVTRDILDVLLLKLKFDSEGKEVICNVCRRKLNAAFEFKATCLKTDYTIIPYVNCEKMLQLDIRDVYTKEKTSESMDISDSQKICRLCMEPVESEFRCVREEELEAIEKLAPEMNINIIKDPVVCKECFDSVCTHNSFLKNCWEVQEKIKGIFNNAATESQIDTSPSDLFVKTENEDKEFDINEMEMSIKAESIDIKSEDEERSDSLLQSSDSESFEKSVLRDAEEDKCKHENRSTNQCNMKDKQDDKVFFKCDKCIYETGSESRFIAHRARHENDSEAYKCETENKKFFQKHQLRHKDPSKTRMHRCGSYGYKTRHRCELAKSQVKHKSASEGRLYNHFCDFKTKRKVSFNSHYIKHKNSNNRVECDYKIKNTALPNKDTLQLHIYKCDGCTYQSKNKRDFTRHQLIYKDPSQVKMYGCSNVQM
ncbi:zinc finger and BTB domain-containing protein 41-like [Anoplophora glabripennis]|uniref:zinc finger and BTB domain-containing protein 41-like n=1 Tax=Anoplophora glabripennis TaxID=217634 RepID=UPI000C75D6C5|nr:zinc finger and BTB domain-containing protein 41-like [Anoplophora glabripennis]